MEFGASSHFCPVCDSVCLSVTLFVTLWQKKLNLVHNFWTVGDIDFIVGMYTQLIVVVALFTIAEGWLVLDIRLFVLFLY